MEENTITNFPYKLINKVDYSSRRLNYLVERLVMFHKQIMFTKCVNVFFQFLYLKSINFLLS